MQSGVYIEKFKKRKEKGRQALANQPKVYGMRTARQPLLAAKAEAVADHMI